MQEQNKKVLVCITPQSNSKRLIDRGYDEIKVGGGELNILTVQKGLGIFNQSGAAELIQSLFEYGALLGANVFSLIDEDIPGRIAQFVEENSIDIVVLGAPVKQKLMENQEILSSITEMLKDVEVIILERKEEQNVAL